MSDMGFGNLTALTQGSQRDFYHEMDKSLGQPSLDIQPLAEFTLDNYGKITLVRRGESTILHIARSKDESITKWMGEAIGAAAYGAYSHPRDVVYGIVWAISFTQPGVFKAKQEADECLAIFIEAIKLALGNIQKVTTKDIKVFILLALIAFQVSTRNLHAVSALTRFTVGKSASIAGMTVSGVALGFVVGEIPGALKGADLGAKSFFYFAILGSIFQATLKIRELKKKGKVIHDTLSIVLNHIITGGVDIVSISEKLGKDAYEYLVKILEDEKLIIEFNDFELQIINDLTKLLCDLFNDAYIFFQKVLSEYKEDFS